MTLFGSSLFGNDSSGNDPSGNDNSGNGFFGNMGNISHRFGWGSDSSGNDVSGNDGSGNTGMDLSENMLDASGNTFQMLYGQRKNDPSGTDLITKTLKSIGRMFFVAFIGAIIVLILFVTSQSLAFLSLPEQLEQIPININEPPYSSDGSKGGFLHGYGFPYTLRTGESFLGFGDWVGDTTANSWIKSRTALKYVLRMLQGISPWLLMIFGWLFIFVLLLFAGIVSFVFSLMASFQASVMWTILGIFLFGIMWGVVGINSMLQHFALLWFLVVVPFLSVDGRHFIRDQIHEHQWGLRFTYSLVLILLSAYSLGGLDAIGMIIGVVLFGF